jgi:hypothetical protein
MTMLLLFYLLVLTLPNLAFAQFFERTIYTGDTAAVKELPVMLRDANIQPALFPLCISV